MAVTDELARLELPDHNVDATLSGLQSKSPPSRTAATLGGADAPLDLRPGNATATETRSHWHKHPESPVRKSR